MLRFAALAATVGFVALTATRADAALHPGDRVDVTVYNHPELSGTRTLDASGTLFLPVAGSVSAKGLEPAELAEKIRSKLTPYLRKPAVNVQLDAQTASIFVAGGPNGVVPYQPGETLLNVVDRLQLRVPAPIADTVDAKTVAAQDVSNASLDLGNGPINFRTVHILRDNTTMGPFDVIALRSSGQTGPALLPGDTIELANKPIAVSVLGEVEKPGIAYLDPNEPLSQAINQVGGVAATGTQSSIVLERGGASQMVSAGNPIFSQPAQSGDKVIVARAPRVDVLGEVSKPGQALLRGNTTLVSAIYNAGGPAEFANLKSVQVVHGAQRTSYNLVNLQKGGTGDNPQLADGDVVFVPKGSTFRMSDVWSALGSLGLFGVHL